MHLAFLVRRLAHMDGARSIRAVAVLEAAEVEHDHVAVLDRAVAGLVVRVGAVRPGASYGEVDLRMAVLDEQTGQVGGDLGFLAPREPHLKKLLEEGVAAAPAAASRSSSSASLTARSVGSAELIETKWVLGSACWRPSSCSAQAESEIAQQPAGSSSPAAAA